MRKSGLAICVILFAQTLAAQTEKSSLAVEKTINTLFEAMQKGDSALLRTVFSDNVTLATIGQKKDGSPFIKHDSGIANFQKAIGTQHPEPYHEPIWNLKIQVDGNFAQAWADYAFYVGKKFSHCGVDAFQLYQGADGIWKIFHLADTRRTVNCVIPKNVQEQYR